MWNLPEGNHDFGDPLRQSFASAQIKWGSGPAPIAYRGLQGDEGFRGALRVANLLRITWHRLSPARASPILAAYRERGHIRVINRLQRLQDLQFFVTHRIRSQRCGRLHGYETKELQQMILHHVAQRAGRLVIGPAALDANRLGNRDLDMVNMGRIPQRFEQGIGEAQGYQILHRLLAEIMVDAENLVLRKYRADRII